MASVEVDGKGNGGGGGVGGGGGLLSVEGRLGRKSGLLADQAPSEGSGSALSHSSGLQLVCMCLGGGVGRHGPGMGLLTYF